jgi:hypothetical protein
MFFHLRIIIIFVVIDHSFHWIPNLMFFLVPSDFHQISIRFPGYFQDFNAPRVAWQFFFSRVGLARGLGSHPAAVATDGPFARAEAELWKSSVIWLEFSPWKIHHDWGYMGH